MPSGVTGIHLFVFLVQFPCRLHDVMTRLLAGKEISPKSDWQGYLSPSFSVVQGAGCVYHQLELLRYFSPKGFPATSGAGDNDGTLVVSFLYFL